MLHIFSMNDLDHMSIISFSFLFILAFMVYKEPRLYILQGFPSSNQPHKCNSFLRTYVSVPLWEAYQTLWIILTTEAPPPPLLPATPHGAAPHSCNAAQSWAAGSVMIWFCLLKLISDLIPSWCLWQMEGGSALCQAPDTCRENSLELLEGVRGYVPHPMDVPPKATPLWWRLRLHNPI